MSLTDKRETPTRTVSEESPLTSPATLPMAREYRTAITVQQAEIFVQTLQQAQMLQDKLNTIAMAILAGRGVTKAQGIRMEWKNPKTPFLIYLVVPDDVVPGGNGKK